MRITDKLFDVFASPENLKIAFGYIQHEVRKSSLPLDPFWTPGISAVEVLGDAFFVSLSKILIDGTYEPGEAYFFDQHKDNFGIRKIAMLNIVDRIVYQAIFNKSVLGGKLVEKFSPKNYYPRLSKYKSRYLQKYKPFYSKFINEQKEATALDYKWRGEFDVSAFYDNVNHRILFEKLSKDLKGSQKVVELLERILKKWHIDRKGIPQGPDASSVLANYYLTSIDKDFSNLTNGSMRYLRYMDDIVILSSRERDLYTGIELLTENLSKLDLNLNAKSDIEEVSLSWYEQIQFLDPYTEPEGDDVFDVFNEIKDDIPGLLERLKNKDERKSVKHRELSKLKYYLKVDRTYEFVRDIILLYPHLPSFADVICKYILPISSRAGVRILILKIFAEQHLFRWQRFWLAKVLLLEDLKKQNFIELGFQNDKVWETRAISRFVTWWRNPEKINLSDLLIAYFQSDNEFERNLYLGFLGKFDGGKVLAKFYETAFEKSSLEGRTILLSQFLSKDKVLNAAKTGNLFFLKTSHPIDIQNSKALGYTSDKLNQTLGFPLDLNPGKQMVLEIKANNNELVLTGKLLNGIYIKASTSSKSRLTKLMIYLCRAHVGYEKSRFKDFFINKLKDKYPQLDSASVDKINMAREKTDRVIPLLGKFIDQFLTINQQREGACYSFRRGIDDTKFIEIPEEEQQEMAKLAKQATENPVKR